MVSLMSYLCIECLEETLGLYGWQRDDIFNGVIKLFLVDMVTH